MAKHNALKLWWDQASQAEKRRLATLAKTTVGSLQYLAGGYRRDGGINIRAGMAILLEQASSKVHEVNPALPVLFRTELSHDCSKCEFAQHAMLKRKRSRK